MQMQGLLNQAVWEADEVRNDLQKYVVIIIMESDLTRELDKQFPKDPKFR